MASSHKYPSLPAMLKDLQHGKTIDQLYQDVERKQSQLVDHTLAAATTMMFASKRSITGYSDATSFQNALNSAGDDQKKIQLFNSVAEQNGFGLQVYSSGHKTKERALKKIASHKMEPWQLSDILRISVTADNPGLLDTFLEQSTKDRRYAHDGWSLRASGILGSGFRIAIDDSACQVHLGEYGQVFNAERVSHKLYTVMRLSDELATDHSPEFRQEIIKKYNNVAQTMQAIANKEYDSAFSGILTAKQFETVQTFAKKHHFQKQFAISNLPATATDAEIRTAAESLLALHQIIHASFMAEAPEAWRNLYVAKARTTNQKHGMEIFPEALLGAIPHQSEAVAELMQNKERKGV